MRIRVIATGLCLFAVATSEMTLAATQSWPADSWEISTPAKEGLDEAAIRQLDAEIRAGKHGYVDSMLIIRHGRIVFEALYPRDYKALNAHRMTGEPGQWNYNDANWHPYYQGSDLHTMQSTTKSVMSALVGIAIARGDLPGVDATLGQLLPHRRITDPAKAAITLENVLTMRPGFEWVEDQVPYWDPRNDATRVESTNDWVGYLLAKPLAAPQGTVYNYNSENTQLMSEIVSTATGKPLDEYAKELLFHPIGIRSWHWKSAPEGFRDVAGGLYLAPRDLARFALLYEKNGEWNGRQVLPAAWVRQSVTPHVRDTNPEDPDVSTGYGYQWWVFNDGSDGRPVMFGTWGWGGQFGFVVPSLNVVAVFTGWNVYDDVPFEYAFKLFYDRIIAPPAKVSQ
jgi:CubicO group peptidase (beta-lactamase class C family)